MRLLVVGASGFLGAQVCRQAMGAGWSVVGTYHSGRVEVPGVETRRLDVTDRAAVRELVARVRPEAVVGTPYRYGDWAVTADGAAHVAYAAVETGPRLVHVSSDAVHAGRPEPYADDEPPSPIFPYGAAKAAAETAVRVLDPGAVLVRTSLIVGEGSKQIELCRDAVSRAELGLLVAAHAGIDPAGMKTTSGAAAGVLRPAEVRLDSTRAAGLLGTRLRGVRELLTR